MLGLFLLLLIACTATTNVPEWKEPAAKLCPPNAAQGHYRGVSLDREPKDDADHLVLTYRYDLRLQAGLHVGDLGSDLDAASAAIAARSLSPKLGDPKFFQVWFLDADDEPLCEFRFERGKDMPVLARCR